MDLHEKDKISKHLNLIKNDHTRISHHCKIMENRVKRLERQIERLLPNPLLSDLEGDVVVLTDIESTDEDIDLFQSE